MCEADSADRKDTEAQVLGLAAEVCQRYRLIAAPWLNEHTPKKKGAETELQISPENSSDLCQ